MKKKNHPTKQTKTKKPNRLRLGDSQAEAVTRQGVKQIKCKAVNQLEWH